MFQTIVEIGKMEFLYYRWGIFFEFNSRFFNYSIELVNLVVFGE